MARGRPHKNSDASAPTENQASESQLALERDLFLSDESAGELPEDIPPANVVPFARRVTA